MSAKYSNTVKSCVAKFLRNKHRDEFMALNPWMDITVASIVFFRRHTSHKTWYASYRDISDDFKHVGNPESTDKVAYQAEWDQYNKAAWAAIKLHWWQIPVSQKQCAGIKPATLARYYAIIQEVIAAEMAEDFVLHDLVQDVP
jgi:hypothetical protein